MRTFLFGLFTALLLFLIGCGGGGGGSAGGGGVVPVTRRDASIRAAQGFFAFDRISPSQNWISNPDSPLRGQAQTKRGLKNFIVIADAQIVGRGLPSNEFFQEFDLGLWYRATIVSSISTRFDLREDPNNAATDAGTITVTKTSLPGAAPAYEINLAITRGNFPITGLLRFIYQSEALTDGRLVADYLLAAGSTPIRLQYDDNFDINGYAGIFTLTRGSVVTSISNVENVDAFSRVIADFNAAGFTGSITQETIDGSYTVFLQGDVTGQDWVIEVDGNGSAVITPPNLPAEAPVSILSL